MIDRTRKLCTVAVVGAASLFTSMAGYPAPPPPVPACTGGAFGAPRIDFELGSYLNILHPAQVIGGPTGGVIRDNFDTAAYSNNDGTLTFDIDWIETNDDSSATTGLILITSGELSISGAAAGTAIFTADFNTDEDSFSYSDDTFRGTSEPGYASGMRLPDGGSGGVGDGALQVRVGNLDDVDIGASDESNLPAGMSGGWSRSFTLGSAATVQLQFDYFLDMALPYELDEFGEAVVSIDGTLVGVSPNDYINRIAGGGTAGWTTVSVSLGALASGSHDLILGAYNNKKTFNDEDTEVLIDDVMVSEGAGSQPTIEREVDFETPTAGVSENVDTAQIRFQWRTTSDVVASDTIIFELSDDGGATWTDLPDQQRPEIFSSMNLADHDGSTFSGLTGVVSDTAVFYVPVGSCPGSYSSCLNYLDDDDVRFRFRVVSGYNSGNKAFVIDEFYVFSGGQPYAPWGTIFAVSAGGSCADRLLIFDSANPTGGDLDLGSPNETCLNPPAGGWPGVGAGGELGQPAENCVPVGRIAIVDESNGDELHDRFDPDDCGSGATINIYFTDPSIQPPPDWLSSPVADRDEVDFDEISLLDLDSSESLDIAVYDVNNIQVGGVIEPVGFGDNSYVLEALDITPISRIQLTYPASGSIDDIVFCREPTWASVADFTVYEQDGVAVAEWQTHGEVGTLGFNLYRAVGDEYVRINEEMIDALQGADQGGTYRMADLDADPAIEHTWFVEEVSIKGTTNPYGPWTMPVEALQRAPDLPLAEPHRLSADETARLEISRELQVQARQMIQAKAAGAINSPADAVRIGVDTDGVYFVDAVQLAGAFQIPVYAVDWMIRAARLSISNGDKQIGWSAARDGSGLYFYGQAAEGVYSDENAYWLQPGRGVRGGVVDGAPQAGAANLSYVLGTINIEENYFAGTVVTTDPERDYWFWSGLAGGYVGGASRDFAFDTPDVVPSVDASLRVRLRGANDRAHGARIRFNGLPVGEILWEGLEYGPDDIWLTVPSDRLEQSNTVTVEALVRDGAAVCTNSELNAGSCSIFYIDGFDFVYPRNAAAAGGQLKFAADGDGIVEVSGLAGSGPAIFDVTDPTRLKRVRNIATDAKSDSTIRFAGQAGRAYVATTKASALDGEFLAWRDPGLRDAGNATDYLVIAPVILADAAQSLADYRASQGLDTMVVELEDIMHAFGDGSWTPHAIRDFLRYAWAEWDRAPSYVVLVGEGSFDFKGYRNGGSLIPPLMVSTADGLFASDNLFADVSGDDGIPDIAIGRLPFLTPGEVLDYVDKLQTSENITEDRIIFASGDFNRAGDFPIDSKNLAAGVPAGYDVEMVSLDGLTIDQARSVLFGGVPAQGVGGLNDGALLLNWVGHGGMDRLDSGGLVTSADANLINGPRLPIITALTCVVGRFETDGFSSLGETMVRTPQAGALAVWSPTGLSSNYQATRLGRFFLQAAFGGEPMRLGDAILLAMFEHHAAKGAVDTGNIYNLLGDPAIPLR